LAQEVRYPIANTAHCECRREGQGTCGGPLNASSEMNPYGPYSMYKTSYGSAELPDTRRDSISRLVISTAQLALLMLAPWALFATLSWALMSRQVYLYSWIRVFVICIFTGLVLVLLVAAATSRSRWLRKGGRIGEADPRYLRAYAWWAGLAGLCFIAFVAGCIVGTIIADSYMKKFYQITSLDAYDNVNPARSLGKEMLDAGRVIFTKGSRLDFNHSFAHQNGSTFCVVPIIAASDQPLPATFDFWAAGKDCCTNLGENFHCGAADSKAGSARGGLRLLSAEDEYNYRQAVRFSEIAYHMESVHPLFFEWTANPIRDIGIRREAAFGLYFATNVVFLLGIFILVVIGYVCFPRMAKI